MIKTWILLLLISLCSYPLMGQEKEKDKSTPMEVVLGEDKVVKLDFAASPKVQVGNETILTYQLIPQKREITLKGQKPGKTSVIIRNTLGDIKARYLVTIRATDQSKIVKELKEFLGDVEGLEIGIKGESVYVGGQIVVPNDIGRVVLVLAKYPDVIRLVELSPHTQRIIAKKMQEEIQKNNLRNVTVRVVNGLFWLEGVVTSNGEKAVAEKIAAAYVPERIESLGEQAQSVQQVRRNIIQNFVQVNQKSQPPPVPKLIKITSQFVELTRDYNKVFGFKWQPLLSDGNGSINIFRKSGDPTTNSSNTLAGTISNLFPKLASAKAAGFARVIQSGVLVIKDGIQGSLNKSQEKSFAIGSGEFARSERAKAGFDLTVTPKILQQEKIDLNIGLNVSALVGDPPETLSNTIKTALVVKSQESAVVGGIVVQRTSSDFDRHPPGGQDDFENGSPLFSFVRSKSFNSSKSQFVVFITPEIIDSASAGTEEIKRKFRRRRR